MCKRESKITDPGGEKSYFVFNKNNKSSSYSKDGDIRELFSFNEDGSIQAWVYENTSFELAQNVETETFPWTEEGVEQLRAWLEEKLAQRGTEPYRIPYPAKKA